MKLINKGVVVVSAISSLGHIYSIYTGSYILERIARSSNFDEEVALYRTVNWGKFRGLRFAGDFADVGEEVQISHYRIHR